MGRSRLAVGVLVGVLAAVPLSAQGEAQLDRGLPDRISLPDGWQPEGITTDGRAVYVGSLANGAIWRADLRTGHGHVLAKGAKGRVAVGVDYDRRRDLLWVAGGPTKQVRVHDAGSGRLLRTYTFPSRKARFVNDLVATRHAVYATDSSNQQLLVVPLHQGDPGHRQLPPASAARTVRLTGDVKYVEGEINLNGIVRSGHALVAVQTNTGKLFRINPRTGLTTEITVAGGPLTNGDGLEPDGDLLYVVRNLLNRIAVVDLNRGRTQGMVVASLTDPDLDVPATVALAKHSLWAANARFTTTPGPNTAYWVTRLDEYHD
jgi:sugar lactone lactonase YvrE